MMVFKNKNIDFSLRLSFHLRRIASDLSEKSEKIDKISLINNTYKMVTINKQAFYSEGKWN